jgi:hypothetical protein
MSVQLFAKLQDSQTYVNLDLSANEPIKMVLSVQNIEDPLATTSAFSRTFKVPHTGVNGPYFKGVFNVNSVDFDAAKRADAYILDNGQFFANGQIILNSIYRNEKEKNVEYEITFLGETSDFGAKIGGGFMNQINMNHLNHEKSYANITNSWNNGLFNGDIVYGLIEWGYTYNANNQPVQPTLSNGFAKSFTTGPNALRLSQWKPQYRAKAIWDQVFKEAGYTYDSVFLNDTLFNKLYIISDNVSSAELQTANTFKVDGGGGGNSTNESFLIPYGNETADPSNNFSLVTSAFSVPITGQYTFRFEATAALGSYYQTYSSQADGSVEFVNQTGTVLASIPFSCYNQGYDGWSQNNPSTFFDGTVQLNLTAGDVITTQCVVGAGSPYVSDFFGLFGAIWECTQAPQVLAATGILPANIKKIDFMKAIINRFRLVFVPSKDIQNHFTITPWKDWILEGTVRDWTDKLDDSKDLKIRPLFQGQSRFQIYKDQEDADYLNYGYQLTYKQSYGQLNFDSNNELLTGSKEYKDAFAPTPIAPIGFKEGDIDASRFLIPHIAKDTGGSEDTVGTSVISGKREPIQPKLRLVFYNGLIDAPVDWWMADNDDGSLRTLKTVYPLMSSFSTWPITPSTLDLNWKNSDPFWKATDTFLGPGTTANSCYNVYWKTWNDQVFDPYSRIVDANITLDYQDVLDLKFNDYIFLKDSWYVVNKITDYIPGNTSNCRVELVKLGNIGVTIPYIAPVVYEPIQLCYSATATPCQVFCCNDQVTVSSTYYIQQGYTYSGATQLFLDQNGQLPAPAGIYSNGVNINEYDGTGILIATYNPAECDCIPDVYSFNLIKSKTPCGLCCGDEGSSVVAYGLNATWEFNTLLWLDAAMTVPLPNGWYSDGTLGVVYQFINGAISVAYNCDTCNCLEVPLYPHNVRFNTVLCKACRCGLSVSVWTDNATWENSTLIYSNNVGTIPASEGFYNKSGWYLETDGTSAVTSSGTCPSCTPCKPKVDIDIIIVTLKSGYTTTVTVESSDDSGKTWINEGSVSIIPSDSVLEKTETLSVGEGDIFRVTATSDIIEGDITTVLDVNGADETQNVLSPGFTITNYDLQVLSTDVLAFNMTVTGGATPGVTDVIVGGQFSTYNGSSAFPAGGVLNAILSLNNDGSINDTFDVGDGGLRRANNTITGQVWEIKKVGNQYLLAGNFDHYQNVDCQNGLILLNEDGTIDDNFNSLVGAYSTAPQDNPVGRWVDADNGIAYVGGEFLYWDGAPLGSTTPSYYTASPRMVAINLSDGSINTGFTAQFPTTAGVDIEVIRVHEGQIYVGGNMQLYGADTRRWLYRLNMNGTLDTSFNATHIGALVTDIAFDGDYIYVVGQLTGGIKKILKSDGSAVTWGPTTKFNSGIINESIRIAGDLIYVGGSFNSYNSTTAQKLIALNKSDGTIYTAFDTTTGFNATGARVRNMQLTDTHIYCTGDFTTWKDASTVRIAKINRADATLDTSFATGSGLSTLTVGLLVNTENIDYNCNSAVLNYSSESACDAYCNFATGAESFWINSPDLITATLILTNTQCGPGGNGNLAGWYTDGTVIVEVASGGVIVNTITPESCTCGGGLELYEHTIMFADLECDACCGDGTGVTVWSDSVKFSGSTILYSNSTGTTFADSGWYSNGTTLLNVGTNGVVLENTFCECDCPPQACAEHRIKNLSANNIYYSYIDCDGTFWYGEIGAYASHTTTCTEYNKIVVTGEFTIITGAIC